MNKFLIPVAAVALLAAPAFAFEGGAQGSAGPQHGATLAAAEGGAVVRHDPHQQTLAFADPASPRLILAETEGGGDRNPHSNGQPQEA